MVPLAGGAVEIKKLQLANGYVRNGSNYGRIIYWFAFISRIKLKRSNSKDIQHHGMPVKGLMAGWL